ncbi:MAG: hypothetical protein K2N70_00160, partial [Helicobacter sp.]|nr:hypothetical protein [Helicobacter sp.]
MENNEGREQENRSDSTEGKEKTDSKEGTNKRRFPRRTRSKSPENRKKPAPNDKAGEKKHKSAE